MASALDSPIPARRLALIAAATVVLLAAYCLAYNGLQGDPVTLGSALAWPLANVVPILIGMEYARRQRDWPLRATILIASLAVALLIGAALATQRYAIGFEAIRRLPVLAGCTAALFVLDRLRRKGEGGRLRPAELPIEPQAIDWVEAAANYVVLHGKGFSRIHRATLAEAEVALADHGFVRIHRSRLVARASIARVRPLDVVLKDGSCLPTGARYRHALPGPC